MDVERVCEDTLFLYKLTGVRPVANMNKITMVFKEKEQWSAVCQPLQ